MLDFLKKIWNFICSIPSDKLLHFIAGLLINLFVVALMTKCAPVWLSFLVGNVITVSILALKEYYDSKHKEHSVELWDFLYGCIGALIADVGLLIVL